MTWGVARQMKCSAWVVACSLATHLCFTVELASKASAQSRDEQAENATPPADRPAATVEANAAADDAKEAAHAPRQAVKNLERIPPQLEEAQVKLECYLQP